MPSVNKVILLGNLGKDPEVRYAQNGDAVCNISLATTSKWKDKGTGEVKEDTQWHRVVFYGRLAEIVGEYVKKGSPIYVEGRLKYGKYTDKDGVERYTTDIVATELQLLGGREGGQQGSGQQQRGAAPAQRGGAPAQRTAAPAPRQQSRGQPSTGTGFDDMDDDIPF